MTLCGREFYSGRNGNRSPVCPPAGEKGLCDS
ncbi:MAG: hypothetical protein ACOX37_07595 [Bacillota bacterium]